MALTVGDRLGPYEIVALIGVGGMGEVYKARDTRLDRVVAVKVLPAHFAGRPDVRERFDREARTIAALNHPHICVLHDIGHQDGVDFLVMEYLEGETLAQRLAKGPLPLEQVFEYAIQMSDALDKAHRKGVTHRDLKPGNIMLTKNGSKLVDFGLAKLTQDAAPVTQGSENATKTDPLTAQGMLLGTLQYMAPEQVEGKVEEIDARTDIFAFGAVVYEMATGKKAFEGRSQASLIGAILKDAPPPMSSLQPMTPPALERVVKTCLAKDPESRWQTARDLTRELQWIAEGAHTSTPTVDRLSRVRERVAWGTALVLALAVAMILRESWQTAAPSAETYQLSVVTPETSSLLDFAISPDGRTLAFVARAEGGKHLLWVRRLDTSSPQALPGTDGAAQPFWAPDSRSLGFFAEGKLKRVEAAGGPPQTIADAGSSRGGAWNRGGVILFAPAATAGLFQVSAAGGALTPVTIRDPKKESSHRWPQFLPDGMHFLFYVQAAKGGGVSVGSLDSKDTRHLFDTNAQAWYAPPGFLLFVRDGSLMAQSFDAGKAELGGDPMRIAEGLMFDATNRAAFSTAGSGILAYRNGASALNQMAWFDRSGKPLGTAGPRGRFFNPELSPDAKQVAFQQQDLQTGNIDVWVLDLARGEPRRLTFDPAPDIIPRWSPDGKQIIFQSNRDGPFNIYQKLSGGAGSEARLFPSPVTVSPQDWSADGRFLLCAVSDAKGNWQLWVLPMSGERKLIPFVENGANNHHAQFSRDSRWIAYASNESGRYEVYVQSFPAGNGKWQVSTNGGVQPRWRRDGKELFYLGLERKLRAVPVRGVSTIEFGVGVPLFEARTELGTTVNSGWMQQYDVTPDGQRFLLNLEPDSSASHITAVLNWAAGLKK